jgi:hypothetical protein
VALFAFGVLNFRLRNRVAGPSWSTRAAPWIVPARLTLDIDHIMKRVLLLSAVATLAATAGAPSLRAQGAAAPAAADSTATSLAHQILQRSGATDLALNAIDANVAAQRQLNPRVPSVVWDRFSAAAHARKGELEDRIAASYERHFTADELRQILAFYDTPVGKKLAGLQPTLMQEGMLAGREWGMQIGAEVTAQLQSEGALKSN